MIIKRILQAGVLCGIIHLFVYGSTKPPSGTNAPPAGLMMCAPRRFAAPPIENITGFSEGQIAAKAAFVSTRTNEVWDFSPPDGATIVERWKKHGAARRFKLATSSLLCRHTGRVTAAKPPKEKRGGFRVG